MRYSKGSARPTTPRARGAYDRTSSPVPALRFGSSLALHGPMFGLREVSEPLSMYDLRRLRELLPTR